MKREITVRESTVDNVLVVHQNIIEFDEKYPAKDFFLNRYSSLEHIIIVSYCNEIPIGYIIGYEIDKDNFYLWLAGVDINYRGLGAFEKMMNYLIEWCKSKNYEKISIKTRNKYRGMLTYLVKNNWHFLSVEKKGNLLDYRINLELELR